MPPHSGSVQQTSSPISRPQLMQNLIALGMPIISIIPDSCQGLLAVVECGPVPCHSSRCESVTDSLFDASAILLRVTISFFENNCPRYRIGPLSA